MKLRFAKQVEVAATDGPEYAIADVAPSGVSVLVHFKKDTFELADRHIGLLRAALAALENEIEEIYRNEGIEGLAKQVFERDRASTD